MNFKHQYIKYDNIWGIISLIMYKILLDIVYIQVLVPYYDYAGFKNDLSQTKNIICYVLLLVIAPYIVTLYRCKHSVFSYLVVLVSILSFIPNLTIITYNPLPENYLFAWILYWIIFYLSCKYLPFIKIKIKQRKSNSILYIYMLILSFSILFVSGVYTGFRFHFNLFDVYEIRGESKEFDYPGIFAYLIPASGVILPIILLYLLEKKRYILSVIITVVILLNFGIGGHKKVFLSLFVTLFFYYFYRENIIKSISWCMNGLCVCSLLEYKLLGTFTIVALIIRRVLFIPAQLNIFYFDFFTTHSPDYFRQSFLRHIGLISPYKDPIPIMISNEYTNPGDNENNGLFSDAVQNMGIIGVILFPILIVALIKFIDSLSKGIPIKYTIVPSIMIAIAFLSTNIMATLLTSGVIFVMYLYYVFPRELGNKISHR